MFELGELIGAGGMGRVFSATYAERRIAVKLLHDELVRDPNMVARFADEALAARRVSHRNVVRVIEHGFHSDGSPFLAMEHAPGITLGELIEREGTLPLTRIRAIGTQILLGLGAIHRAGLLHGDMKSDNVLVDVANADKVTIIDFGLARSVCSTAGVETVLSGTPEYMAPEVIRGEAASVSTDLYAVGVILYEMLTGTTPFAGGNAAEIFERHLTDEVVPPSLRAPERTIPAVLEGIVMRALAKDASLRHFDAELFATALSRCIPASFVERQTPARLIEPRSTSRALTNEWSRQQTSRKLPHPRRRFAEGTLPRDNDAIQTCRDDLSYAIAGGDPGAIITACLSLVEVLCNEHRLLSAARELETAITWLASDEDAPLWRLQLTLAAIYDGLGDRPAALSAATAARTSAKRLGDAQGTTRANALARRLRADTSQPAAR
ncbi:MAG TPA: serine/threonine-protein kinase [Kofleriaceae bacterium]|nr:serine/threonine-protein kinase [Kofleriaceae bacterium]